MIEEANILVPRDILEARAEFLGVETQEYLGLTPRQRNMKKAVFIKKLRSDARDGGIDPDSHVEAKMATFPRGPDTEALEKKKALKEKRVTETSFNGQPLVRLTPEKRAEIQAKARLAVTEGPQDKPQLPPSHVRVDGIKLYTTGDGEIPPGEEDPLKRDGMTIGSIRELEKPPTEDLVGDRSPRTLTDLYARWPIGDDPSYAIRIERTKPKRHAGVDVAGFVGEVRGRVVLESDLQRWLGGTEYLLTVYGPDPRGKRDINDLPIIKPLTEPIKLIVPVLPPNVAAIPAFSGNPGENMQHNPMNPFAPQAPQLTNQHDANIHKTNTDFSMNLLKFNREDAAKQERVETQAHANMFALMQRQQELLTETQREEARTREKLMEQRLADERDNRRAAEAKMEKLSQVFEEKTGKGLDMEGLSKLLTTVGPNREAENQRQAEHYRMQMETMKSSHEESLRQLRDRHHEEVKRCDERLKDNETFYKRMLEDERTKANERERDLRAETEKIRREERELAATRLQDAKERYESELRQAEKSHERELRSLKESFEVKVDVADRTHGMTMTSMQERLQEAQAEADRAREEAKESSDPVKVMEKAKAQAEAMGFEKKDDAPKTAFERFAATAGAGLSQALSNINEWGPQVLAGRAAAQQQQPPRMLPPHQQQMVRQQQMARPQQPQQQIQRNPAAQQAAPVTRRKSRAAAWATENVGAMQPPIVPDTPLGFQREEAPQEEPPVMQHATSDNEENNNTSQVVSPEDVGTGFPPLPVKFTESFSDEAIYGFLGQVEQSINGQIEPMIFAEQFMMRFPDAATELATKFEDKEIVEAIRAIPGSEQSPILRRDGEKWLEGTWEHLRKQISARNSAT